MTVEVFIYPHNDLSNLAAHHRKVINDKANSNSMAGISLDCMSFIISLAFSVEALVNFIGFKKVPGWNEMANFNRKIAQLKSAIALPYDANIEPYRSLDKIRVLRNQMAHAKPIEKAASVSSHQELHQEMTTPWDEYLTPNFVNFSYDKFSLFENDLLARSGISIHDSVTRGSGSFNN